MTKRDIIVIGASSGGIQPLTEIIAGLPANLMATLFVVVHIPPEKSFLPEILSKAGKLRAVHPQDGEKTQLGRIYVARPDNHMLLEGSVIRIIHGPKENGSRPAIDPLFRSAGRSFRERVVAVLLSGALDDGAFGMRVIKDYGGTTIVQDPQEAPVPNMPLAAIKLKKVDHCLRIAAITPLLLNLTTKGDKKGMTGTKDLETGKMAQTMDESLPGKPPAPFVCPACGGNLWEFKEGGQLRYQCRIGHKYSQESMVKAHTDSLDNALWSALRSLKEHAQLLRRMEERSQRSKLEDIGRHFGRRAREKEEEAAVLYKILTKPQTPE